MPLCKSTQTKTSLKHNHFPRERLQKLTTIKAKSSIRSHRPTRYTCLAHQTQKQAKFKEKSSKTARSETETPTRHKRTPELKKEKEKKLKIEIPKPLKPASQSNLKRIFTN